MGIADKERSTCNGITLNEYADKYERAKGFKLDPADTLLLKYLTVDTLFCKHCYRPFDPKNKFNMKSALMTPFWAMSEILSIYLFYPVMIPLAVYYGLLSVVEYLQNLMDDTT